MKTMKPMGINSTPFISYHDIKVDDIDPIEDAMGFNSEFNDVIYLLSHVRIIAGKSLTRNLIEKIRRQV